MVVEVWTLCQFKKDRVLCTKYGMNLNGMKDVQMRKKSLENVNKSGSCVRWEIVVSLQFEIRKKVTQLLNFYVNIKFLFMFFFKSQMCNVKCE